MVRTEGYILILVISKYSDGFEEHNSINFKEHHKW